MRRGQMISDEEAEGAAREAMWGAAHGAAIWGIYGIVAGVAAYTFFPVYRGLTIPFKTYLQMSCMTVGACLESDKRSREYEVVARRYRRLRREQELWRQYNDDYVDEQVDSRAAQKQDRAAAASQPSTRREDQGKRKGG